MLLTLLAAMGIRLILVWLSHLVGHSHVLDWSLVVAYLLCAWVAAVSRAQVRGLADVGRNREFGLGKGVVLNSSQ